MLCQRRSGGSQQCSGQQRKDENRAQTRRLNYHFRSDGEHQLAVEKLGGEQAAEG